MTKAVLLLAVAAAGMCGCVPHRPYRLEKPTDSWRWSRSREYFKPVETKVDMQRADVPPGAPEPKLAVVEFDDHGELWSRRQSEAALDMLRKKDEHGKLPLTILYVHGWKHNASDHSADYQSFQELLRQLSMRPELTKHFSVRGVYVGWSGDIVPKALELATGFIPRQLTLYSRMDTADRIANGLPFTQFVSQVGQITIQDMKGRCVMIGHSLGGRILETTLTRTLSTAVAAPGPNGMLSKPADLVVLVNPASDGLRARQTLLAVKWAPTSNLPTVKPNGERGEHYAVPLIVYVRSQSDVATSGIYRLAMMAGKAWHRTRTYPDASGGKADNTQFDYITCTAPTMAHLLTHRMEPSPGAFGTYQAEPDFDPLKFNLSNNVAMSRFPLTLKGNPDKGKSKSLGKSQEGDTIRWYGIVEDHGGNFKMYEPTPQKQRGSCWIMEVPKAVLAGHSGDKKTNGIFSTSMIEFFAALYKITQPAIGGTAVAAKPSLASPEEQTAAPRAVAPQNEKALPAAPGPGAYSGSSSVPSSLLKKSGKR